MDFKKRIIEELGMSKFQADTLYEDYVSCCEKLAKEYHESKVPESLTAENGAKALLMGEFHEILEDENNPGNPFIVPVSWDNIKAIYSKVREHFLTK